MRVEDITLYTHGIPFVLSNEPHVALINWEPVSESIMIDTFKITCCSFKCNEHQTMMLKKKKQRKIIPHIVDQQIIKDINPITKDLNANI